MALSERLADASLTDHLLRDLPKGPYPPALEHLFSLDRCESAFQEISAWPGYARSNLLALWPLSKALGLGSVHYQDESKRFGLGSFKALGGAFAVMQYLSAQLGVPIATIRRGDEANAVASMTVATATDGNHGRSVAWGAQMAGCRCKIFIHQHVSAGRQAAMEAYGAEVIKVDGDYDYSVRVCAEQAEAFGWQVISDTSYGDYRDIPRDVMAGYSVIASEVLQGMQPPPTHVILQAGVGGMAAAVAAKFWMALSEDRPKIVIVEADRAACIIASMRKGSCCAVPVIEETVMAGLSCGEPSEVAFEILSQVVDATVTINDDQVAPMMRDMATGEISGTEIESGECGVPGIIALAAIMKVSELAKPLGLNRDSGVLVIGCEGATDPDVYKSLLASVA